MTDTCELYSWAAALCARSEKCRNDIMTKLRLKGVTSGEAVEITDRLELEGFIDEARYAHAFAADKLRFDHWGRIKIRHHLMAKGIDATLIDEVLADVIDEADYRTALSVFIKERQRRILPDEDGYKAAQKVARAAINRGYEPYLVFECLHLDNE